MSFPRCSPTAQVANGARPSRREWFARSTGKNKWTLPARFSRRTLLRNLAAGLAFPTFATAYATQVEPFWPQFHELSMPVKNLPAAFDGLLYLWVGDVLVCYRCGAQYRGLPPRETYKPFDLGIGER